MFENPAAVNGTGKASGKITYENDLFKSTTPPVKNASVMLIDELTGLPVDYVLTDENGYYEITGIAAGEYTIYVDIPGLLQETTHRIIVTESELVFDNLNFSVDIVTDFEIIAIDGEGSDIDDKTSGDEVLALPCSCC